MEVQTSLELGVLIRQDLVLHIQNTGQVNKRQREPKVDNQEWTIPRYLQYWISKTETKTKKCKKPHTHTIQKAKEMSNTDPFKTIFLYLVSEKGADLRQEIHFN